MTTDLCAQLESVLMGLLAAHEELLEVARRQRQAMLRADGAAIEACARQQGEIVSRVQTLEEERRRLVASLGGTAAIRVSQVAAGLPEPARGRIASLAARLREVIGALQEQHSVLRAAAGALVAHVDGLMQQVSRRVSEAGVYGRQGRVTTGPAACALDVRL